MTLNYCKRCVLPSSRPNLDINEAGDCNCSVARHKESIDWEQRENDFKTLVRRVKSIGADYDCIIPVSGGKDSTWQVVKALEFGLKPLCVTWRTPGRSELGQQNLDNLIQLGVDHMDVSINPDVERRFTLKAFERKGASAIPMHMALHAIPLNFATKFKVPLILWGENSAFEYGGSDDELMGVRLTHAWLKKYGVTNGTVANDWVDGDLSAQDLAIYQWPSDEEQEKAGVTAQFLGHFFKWDPVMTFEAAKLKGFKAADKPTTGYYSFADVDDNYLIAIHHWVKWYKFGFTRTWDNVSLEIRAGRLTRNEAIDILKGKGDETPKREIEMFAQFLEVPVSRIYEIAETFRNHDIWTKKNNQWVIEDFLLDGWNWGQ
ncbi:MAG: N-acetyl sugar amidotransferase [Phycisphaeraceae bacterium]|nr:N-acetyl sugar amidotransferase [Phycisphaeraceae bacterium]